MKFDQFTRFSKLCACNGRLDNSACEEPSAPWRSLSRCGPDAQSPQTGALMNWTAQSYLKTVQPVPSVGALPHNAGEAASILSTTPAVRCINPQPVKHLRFFIRLYWRSEPLRQTEPSGLYVLPFPWRLAGSIPFEADLRTLLPRKLTLTDPDKIRELATAR